MKGRALFAVLFGMVVTVSMMVGCASAPPPSVEVSPTRDQAVVSVKRDNGVGIGGEWDIYIDGKVTGSVGNGRETRFALKNGNYIMYLMTALGQKSDVVTLTAESNEMAFTAYFSGGLHLTQIVSNAPPVTFEATGLEGAIRRAGEKLINELPEQATIAVINVSSRNRNSSALVIDELEIQLFDAHKFKLVDRKQLDTIRAEQAFQMSGDVSDESAREVGQMLGAGVVITGSITGSGETLRLMLRALDVQTAEVLSLANERF